MAPVPFLLLIEDDDAIRTALELSLSRQGHRVVTAATGEDGLKLLREQRPDLIVLDVMLPGHRRIRGVPANPAHRPAADHPADRAQRRHRRGGRPGVRRRRLCASNRCRAGCWTPGSGRCCGAASATATDSAAFGSLVIDRSAMTVTKNGEDLQLTPTELRLLLELSRRPGQALSRQQLLRLVWEHDYLGDSRLVDACVQRLRAKVEDVPSSPTLIRTVRGVGYRLDSPQ